MRQVVFLLLGIALCLAMPAHLVAEPVLQELSVEITSPEIGEQVRGRIPIMGSASVPSFQFYKVEFGIGPNPQEWSVIGDLHYEPVIDGQLEIWDTTTLPDGVYTLRLHGVKQDGNWEEFQVRQITIANQEPTNTPTPEEEEETTSTPEDMPTPLPTATPEPTATQQIIMPEGELETWDTPTPTPTLSLPTQRSNSFIEPKNWMLSLGYGGLSMAVVFLLLGIIFGLRRLL